MKKTILFVTHNNEDPSDGVWKKIKSQVSAFRNLGYEVDFFYMNNKTIVLDDGASIKNIHNCMIKYFYYFSLVKIIESSKKKYTFSYIRKPHGGFFCVFLKNLLGYLKMSGVYNYIEIPTYPYKKELKTFKGRFLEFIFEVSKFSFQGFIDEVIYIGDFVETIWGRKARRIANGIDVKEIDFIKEKKVNCSTFIIVGVANLEFWHGYDRIIKGLSLYSGELDVVFHIVGYSQPEYNRLELLVKEYNLDSKVIFHGKKSGVELDVILQDADVSLDALGRHRSGNNINCSIKSKEYCARGLPFIKSHDDYSFGDEEFIYQVSPEDKEIDIFDIIRWRANLPYGFSLRERKYAENHLTWEKQFTFTLENK